MDKELEQGNKESWGKAVTANVMLYPSERAISFLARNFKDKEANGRKSAIDIGFGSGRHLKLFLDYNFQTYGIDYAPECIATAKQLLGHNENLKELILDDLSVYDFASHGIKGFDAIIIWGTIFLRPKDEMLADLKRIRSLLNKDGKFFLNFRTKQDSMYGKGKEIIKGNTYILDCKGYENCVYTFLDKNETEEIMREAGFNIDTFEREDYWKNALDQQHSWWVVTASGK